MNNIKSANMAIHMHGPLLKIENHIDLGTYLRVQITITLLRQTYLVSITLVERFDFAE